MSSLGGLRLASRNCVLIRLTALTNWGKFINPYKFSSEALKGHQQQATKCQQWNESHTPRQYYMTRSSSFSQSCINQSQRQSLNPKNAGICTVAFSLSRRPCTFSGQRMRGKEILFGTLSSCKVQHCAAVQISRPFHQSSALKAAPVPVFWLILKPAQKLFAIIVGR